MFPLEGFMFNIHEQPARLEASDTASLTVKGRITYIIRMVTTVNNAACA